MATSSACGSRRYGRRMNVGGWLKRGERKPSRCRGGSVGIAIRALEVAANVGDGRSQAVDVARRRVDGEAGAKRAADPEALHQRLRAVKAASDRDAALVQQGGAVVRM